MAYETANPPFVIGQGANGRKLWLYVDADAVATVDAASYFSNGFSLGMRAGDILISVDEDASPISATLHIVNEASKSGATETVDISDGVAITATDSR